MVPYTFVTGSLDKVEEAKRILKMDLQQYDLDLPEIQALEIEEVVMSKAKLAFELLGKKAVVVEDTGLFIEAWKGLPGALIKWFLKSVDSAGICSMLHEFPTRNAWAKTAVAIYDGDLHIFSREVHGQIASAPFGESGFGWDSIFIPEGSNKTFGEMSSEEKDKYSMRRLAFEAMRDYLSINEIDRS